MLPVGEDGSIIEELVQKLERYLKDAPLHYYLPVENFLDLVYEHYTENNSIAPESTVAGRTAKQNEKKLVFFNILRQKASSPCTIHNPIAIIIPSVKIMIIQSFFTRPISLFIYKR